MIKRQTIAGQTAAHLLEGMKKGRWQGELPGVNSLSVELGVSRETIRQALGMIEEQGFLEKRGAGKARIIATNMGRHRVTNRLRVVILLHDRLEDEFSITLNLILEIRHRLEAAGHVCVFARKSQTDLKRNPGRIIRFVQQTPSEVWIVMSGSLELLQWFEGSKVPVLAIGGRVKGLAIASASRNAIPAFCGVFQDLIRLGHRRITLLSPQERRRPDFSAIEKTMQEVFVAHGVPFGDHNLPDWEETPAGLDKVLTSLFQITPPTAVQVSHPKVIVGVLAFLSRHGFRVPEDVSLICENMSFNLTWHQPEIAHFTCDLDVILKRVVRWVEGVAHGKIDLRQISCPAVFQPGGSIMAVRKSTLP